MWRSSFLVILQACRLIASNFSIKWAPWQVFFNSILSPPHAPPCMDLSPPIKFWWAPPQWGQGGLFSTPVENPAWYILKSSVFKSFQWWSNCFKMKMVSAKNHIFMFKDFQLTIFEYFWTIFFSELSFNSLSGSIGHPEVLADGIKSNYNTCLLAASI